MAHVYSVSRVAGLEVRVQWPSARARQQTLMPEPTTLPPPSVLPPRRARPRERSSNLPRRPSTSERRAASGRAESFRLLEPSWLSSFAIRWASVQTRHAAKRCDRGAIAAQYKIVGSRVALGVLNRLAPPDADRTGALSPIAEITLPDSVKAVAGIPMKAKHFAFAYPLSCLENSYERLLGRIVGSPNRDDDELFFFMLLGGFVYFDEKHNFVQANCVSLKAGEHSLWLDGPYEVPTYTLHALRERLRPVTLELKHASFRSFAWANPDELPGGNGLSTHKELNWSNGAFIYEFTNGQAVFYRVLPTSDGAKPALYADGAKEMAEAFTTVRSMFEQACVDAVRLARDIDLESRSPITTWLGAYGILIPAFYVVGVAAFGYLEEFNTLDTHTHTHITVTTVGYGDLTPQTPYGRLLTAIMAPLGCVVVMGGLVPIVNSLLLPRWRDCGRPWRDSHRLSSMHRFGWRSSFATGSPVLKAATFLWPIHLE